jgi:hypothetical protein
MNRRQNRLLLACGLILVVSQLSLAEPVQWSGNGHSYEVIVSGSISWPIAKSAAEAKGGHLATITSLDELEFVFDLTIDTPGAWISYPEWAVGPWLGARDVGGGTWEWVTDEPYEEIHHPDYPDPNDEDLNCTHEVNGDYLIFWGCTPRPVCNGASGSYHSYVIEYDSIEGQVVIFGPQTTWIYNHSNVFTKFSTNPTFELYAVGYPIGGTYSWEIVDGANKVEIVQISGVDGAEIILRGKKPSTKLDDVKIKVIYSVDSKPYDCTHSVTVQRPTYLRETDEPYTRYDDPDHSYITVYNFEILDKFGYRIVPSESSTVQMPMVEMVYFKPNASNHPFLCPPPPFPFTESDYIGDGLMHDYLSYDCTNTSPNPSDLELSADQTIWIAGWKVSGRKLTYYNNYAISKEKWNPLPRYWP